MITILSKNWSKFCQLRRDWLCGFRQKMWRQRRDSGLLGCLETWSPIWRSESQFFSFSAVNLELAFPYGTGHNWSNGPKEGNQILKNIFLTTLSALVKKLWKVMNAKIIENCMKSLMTKFKIKPLDLKTEYGWQHSGVCLFPAGESRPFGKTIFIFKKANPFLNNGKIMKSLLNNLSFWKVSVKIAILERRNQTCGQNSSKSFRQNYASRHEKRRKLKPASWENTEVVHDLSNKQHFVLWKCR